MDDWRFYEAFKNPTFKDQYKLHNITFEECIRKDAIKRKFIQEWTNLFSGGAPETDKPNILKALISTSYSGSIYRPMTPDRLKTVNRGSMDGENLCIQVTKSTLEDPLHGEVVRYLIENWDPEAVFASVQPLLVKLDQTEGPKWRLDRIRHPLRSFKEAALDGTLNFRVSTDSYIYSIWRQQLSKKRAEE